MGASVGSQVGWYSLPCAGDAARIHLLPMVMWRDEDGSVRIEAVLAAEQMTLCGCAAEHGGGGA